MIYIEPESTDAAFHFSVEEYCIEHFTEDEPVWMLWQTERCVMLGRNQIADAEIDMGEAERLGVDIVRRSSGGGAIFTDMGVLLYTVILPFGDGVDAKQTLIKQMGEPIVRALYKMGVPARLEGRNDILVDGQKVSGMAQYIKDAKLCSHGSLLFDTDIEVLTKVLRTDVEKIQTKALRSMRGRVTNLIEHLQDPIPVRGFWDEIKGCLFEGTDVREYRLTDEDLAQIEKIRLEKYANRAWTFGSAPKFSYSDAKRFTGGKLEVFLEIDGGVVADCRLNGDFMALLPVRQLEERIEGAEYRPDEIRRRLEGVALEQYIGTINADELISCMFG
ncbi:MAG: lipoate--protein ligase [Clostridiales Family XIII bacterium]|nr:lipoate--protein ligase [Clostridiales Family XIII bacterium]